MNDPYTLIDYYDSIAEHYDRYNLCAARRSDEELLAETGANELANRHVLELACGTGRWTKRFCGSARTIVAMDHSKAMLEISRKRNESKTNVTHLRGDIYSLPFRDGCFDGVFAGWLISHIPRQAIQGFLDQAVRVLAQNARIVLTDDNQRVHEELSGPDDHANTYASRVLPDGRKFQILKNLYCEKDLKDVLSPYYADPLYVEGNYHWLFAFNLKTPQQSEDKR